MLTDSPIEDDPVMGRIAAVRPPIPEDELSPDTPRARAMVERLIAGSTVAPARSSRARWARPRWVLPRVGVALAPVTVVIVLLVAGTFSGPDSSGTQPAAAARDARRDARSHHFRRDLRRG